MCSFLIIAGLICILDITGFKCTEEAESILYSEDDTVGATSEGRGTKSFDEKEDKAQSETKAKSSANKPHKRDTNKPKKTSKPNKEFNSKTAEEAEELIKDIYE